MTDLWSRNWPLTLIDLVLVGINVPYALEGSVLNVIAVAGCAFFGGFVWAIGMNDYD